MKHRKHMKQLSFLSIFVLVGALLTSCGSKDLSEESAKDSPTPSQPTAGPVSPSPTDAPPTPTPTPVHASISTKLPYVYQRYRVKDGGSIQQISYPTKDYLSNDGTTYEKPAFVYLPPDYDETKQYNVLYLMHGIGGNESEWGMTGLSSTVKAIMDNLIHYGDIEPFIVVTPNGRSYPEFADTNGDSASFYVFGQELRNDLIPYIESHFAVYQSEYPSDTRDHRAMAGLSMGGMQTINIGMCECLDIISWFGAFSAAPTSYEAAEIAKRIESAPFTAQPVNYMYNLCGRQDNIAYLSAANAAKDLPSLSDKITDGENFCWMECNGGHDFSIWNLGFYNFAQIVFRGNATAQ